MNKLMLLLLLGHSAISFGETCNKVEMSFNGKTPEAKRACGDRPSLDFRGQKIFESEIQAKIKITNNQEFPLVVFSSTMSECGSCKVNHSLEPINPGDSIDLFVNCKNIRANFARKILIYSNQGIYSLRLNATSYVDNGMRASNCHHTQSIPGTSEAITPYKDYFFQRSRWREKDRLNYQKFLNGQISCDEMISRSKKIVWIGDSLSQNFHVTSSIPNALYQIYTSTDYDLFLDRLDNGIESVFEKFSKNGPTYAINLSRVGGTISTEIDWVDRNLARKLMFEDQVDRVLSLPIKPDIVGVWLGHNDLDWKQDIEENESFESFKKRKAKFVTNNYLSLIQKLITGLPSETQIVIYGMADVAKYVEVARRKLESARERDPKLYPETEKGVYERFTSLRPENRERLGELFRYTYHEIENELTTLTQQYDNLKYSDAIYKEVDWGNTRCFHPVDGWHLGSYCKNEIASKVFQTIQ